MAVDTPAKIAILGAGPIGLEAALYARFLGYEVEVFQWHRDPWQAVRNHSHLKMLTPFGMNCSSLAVRALKVQDESYQPPSDAEYLTYQEWLDRYVRILAQTDLVAEFIRLDTAVRLIGKVQLLKTDCPQGEFDRGAWDFRLLVQQGMGAERVVNADVVLDCGGVEVGAIGHGGIDFCTARNTPHGWPVDYFPQDVFGTRRSLFVGKSILVVGDHSSAAEMVAELWSLVETDPTTRIIWLTRHERSTCPRGPMPTHDSIPARDELFQQLNALALSDKIHWRPGQWVERIIVQENQRARVDLVGEQDEQLEVDRIIGQNGYQPDWTPSCELQLDICPITDAPRPFSEYLLKRPSPYSVEYPAPNPQALITSEPNYYVLGSKSFGRMPGFLYQHGLRQIRDVFTIIGDRTDLDLYAQMK